MRGEVPVHPHPFSFTGTLFVFFSPSLCACVFLRGEGAYVMYYGVYVCEVVCNFSSCHWALTAFSGKRHLASCEAAG